MLKKKTPVAAAQTEAAALPKVPQIYWLGAGIYVLNTAGDNRTPDFVTLTDGDGVEHQLCGVIGYHVDNVRGVVTLELQPERMHVEHVATSDF